MRTINLGCGDVRIDGVESHDIDPNFKTDHCFDLRFCPWPLQEETYDEVYFFHCIEHIEKKHHKQILYEIRRILKPDGVFICSFPEFEIILKNWLANKGGMREFWEANIYGLQRTLSDYHVAAMDCVEFRDMLFFIGFKDVQITEEALNDHNTIVHCTKGEPMKSYEKVVYEDVIK